MNGVVETFPELDAIPGIKALFFRRIPDLEVRQERSKAMALLVPYHQQLLRQEGLDNYPFVTAEQVHGNHIAVIDKVIHPLPIADVDGLFTLQRGITLGIYVADCAPVWVVSRDGSAGALLHSGKKGTELNIITRGISLFGHLRGYDPKDLAVVIGPCIRPPCYEVDFAAEIRTQVERAGVLSIHDDRICTACHPDLYYSYRKEQGLTGRMLATLTLLPG